MFVYGTLFATDRSFDQKSIAHANVHGRCTRTVYTDGVHPYGYDLPARRAGVPPGRCPHAAGIPTVGTSPSGAVGSPQRSLSPSLPVGPATAASLARCCRYSTHAAEIARPPAPPPTPPPARPSARPPPVCRTHNRSYARARIRTLQHIAPGRARAECTMHSTTRERTRKSTFGDYRQYKCC